LLDRPGLRLERGLAINDMDDFVTQQEFTKEWRSLLAQAEGDRDPIIDIDVPDDEDDWVLPDLDDVYVIGER